MRPHTPTRLVACALSLVALCLALLTPALAAPAEDAAARTTALVNELMQVKKGADGKLSAADEAANKALFARLDGFVDQEALVGVPLEPHKAALSAAQLAQARTLFWGILRTITYTDTGRFFAQAKWTLKPAKVEGARVAIPVDTYLPEEDEHTEITFDWDTSGASPRLVDLSFDGASLVKDYQNQFGRILTKDGPDGLVKKLQARFDQETTKRGKVE